MKYIQTQLVDATPAIRIITRNGDEIFLAEMQGTDDLSQYADIADGYLVTAPGHDKSIWYAKEDFEKFALPLIPDEGKPAPEAPSISQKMVDDIIDDVGVATLGEKTTVVHATLLNGFEIVESSSCVSPENYDEATGAEICEHRISDKVWELLGFLLQTAVNGVRGV